MKIKEHTMYLSINLCCTEKNHMHLTIVVCVCARALDLLEILLLLGHG